MAMFREFQGRIVNRTIRVGDQIAILFQSAQKGTAGEATLVPLERYLAERKIIHTSDHTIVESQLGPIDAIQTAP